MKEQIDDLLLVVYKDIVKGEIVSGWVIIGETTEEDFIVRIKQWFRKNETVSLYNKTYRVSDMLRCLHFERISWETRDNLLGIFGEYMPDRGTFGTFPQEILEEPE
jgi:hypothetical protein